MGISLELVYPVMPIRGDLFFGSRITSNLSSETVRDRGCPRALG